MSTVSSDCVVHNRKYLSKFHGTINQLRQKNEFHDSILKQLPKKCCSCLNQKGETLFTVDYLRELCHQIQSFSNNSSTLLVPVQPKTIHYVVLRCPSTFTPKQTMYKAGRFVGSDGKNVQRLERNLNIRIYIINQTTSKKLRKSVKELQIENVQRYGRDLIVYFTMNNNNNDQDNIKKTKESLENSWNTIDLTLRHRRTERLPSSRSLIPPSTSFSGDTRWKPKKRISKNKQKIKEKQNTEIIEVPPQPFIPPLKMPQALSKSNYHN